MKDFVVLLRGINVGGKNKIPMADLRLCLEEHGCTNVRTYIQSGNVLLQSNSDAKALGLEIETLLAKNFRLDSAVVKVLVLSDEQLRGVIEQRPKGFGDHPEKYHYDVVFFDGYRCHSGTNSI